MNNNQKALFNIMNEILKLWYEKVGGDNVELKF